MKNKYIDKLNKKDKEEMLSRIKKERAKPYILFGFNYFKLFLKYIILLAIVIQLWFIAFGKVIIYGIIFGLVIDFFLFFIRTIRISKIKREYFDIVPKRK